jgi:hypothetical protein
MYANPWRTFFAESPRRQFVIPQDVLRHKGPSYGLPPQGMRSRLGLTRSRLVFLNGAAASLVDTRVSSQQRSTRNPELLPPLGRLAIRRKYALVAVSGAEGAGLPRPAKVTRLRDV